MESSTGCESLTCEIDGDVAVLCLARPERRNALTQALYDALGRFFASPPEGVRAAVIHGAGDHFCAGLDLAEQHERDVFQTVLTSRLSHRSFDAIERGQIPVVSALRGAVIGGGLELAAATHVRVAEPSAMYALPEGRLGIFVGSGASVRVARLIGTDRIRELMLTGRRLNAEEGQALGLSHYLVAEGEALARAMELAQIIAANAPVTNYMILNGLAHIQEMPAQDGLFTEALVAALTQSTEDAREGLAAFLQKRTPKFQGR